MMNTPPPKNLYEELEIRQPLAVPAAEVFLNLVRTADLFSGQTEKLLAEFGMTGSQYNALRIVGGGPGQGTPILSISKRMVSRDPDMTRLVDRLEKAALVTRHRCDADRRVWYVRITQKGRQLLAQIRPRLDALHAEQLAHLSETQQRSLSKLLFEARKPHLSL
jgi:DNA-binding MarR family transcriptional regulator